MTTVELKEYIFENDKIPFILETIGCSNVKFNKEKGYYYSTQPDGDNPQGVNIKNNNYLPYRSFSRGIDYEDKKDIIDLIQKVKDYNFRECIEYIHKILGLKMSVSLIKSKKSKKIDPLDIFRRVSKGFNYDMDYEVLEEDILNDYIPLIHIDWYKEGIMPWTAKKFRIGYSYIYNRVIIPLRKWDTGELLGTNARTTIKNHKELKIKKYILTSNYPKQINLYGLYENYDEILKRGYVVVYESEKSVLKRHSLNDPTGVAISGHSLSDEQVRILTGLDVDIIISMDNDVDIQEIRHMCEKFRSTRNVYYTFDKWNILESKDSIVDSRNEIYEFFIKYKVKYDNYEHLEYLKLLNEGD